MMKLAVFLFVLAALSAVGLAWTAHRASRPRPDPFGERFPNPTKGTPQPNALEDFLAGKVPPPDPLPPKRRSP